jgi:hypothetical protein
MKAIIPPVRNSTQRSALGRVCCSILLLLICLALVQGLHAVSPPPDGGYPGGNTAEGQSALLSLTTGGFNTAVGFLCLRNNTDASFNTALGAGTLLANTADGNTATGAGALLSNFSGFANTANGEFALSSNTTGSFNTANGGDALFSNTTGGFNTANGFDALTSNTGGTSNTAVGNQALFNLTTGNGNTALGVEAGSNSTTGSNNIYIGDAGDPSGSESNTIAIGNLPASGTAYTNFFVGAVYGVATASTTTLPVIVSNTGQLGTAPSAARFKKQIKPMDKASESLLALKPVTFQYKSDKTNTPQFGLVAEQVAAVNPDLVVCDNKGEIYTVRYEAVNAMLLNEFLKEHSKVEQLENTAVEQAKEIKTLKTALEEQAAQIQKVNARLEMAKPAAKVARSDQ